MGAHLPRQPLCAVEETEASPFNAAAGRSTGAADRESLARRTADSCNIPNVPP